MGQIGRNGNAEHGNPDYTGGLDLVTGSPNHIATTAQTTSAVQTTDHRPAARTTAAAHPPTPAAQAPTPAARISTTADNCKRLSALEPAHP